MLMPDINVLVYAFRKEMPDHARYHHEQIPNSRLTVWPGQAHLGLLAKWREVLGALVESGPR